MVEAIVKFKSNFCITYFISVLKLIYKPILRAMNEIKTMSSGDTAENVSSATDFEQDFRRTIRNGNKIQVIGFAEPMPSSVF